MEADQDEVWSSLQILENRINLLEKTVYSSKKGSEKKEEKIIDTVIKTKKQFKEIEVKYPILVQIWKKLYLLEQYLQPEFMERISSTDDSKVEIILAEEKQLKDTASTLQQIELSKDVLDNKKLQDIPQWNAKLEPLVQVHLQQKANFEDANDRLMQLLTAYNNVIKHRTDQGAVSSKFDKISSVSKQFIQWDNVITQCEMALDAKKSGDD